MSITPSHRLEESRQQAHSTSFRSILGVLVGQLVTVVDSEALEEAPVGRYLDTGIYEAKVVREGTDYLLLLREYKHLHGRDHAEKVRMFLPIDRIKRVTMMKDERLLHI